MTRFLTLTVAMTLSAQPPNPLDHAVELFRQGRFAEAIQPLQNAVATDPASVPARILLVHPFLAMYYPPARGHLDHQIVTRSRDSLRAILQAQPDDAAALHAMAALHLKSQEWHDAQPIYEKRIAREPNDATARYALAYIAFSRWYPDYEQSLTQSGMSTEDPGGHTGPFQDPLKAQLKAAWAPVLDSGLLHIQHAFAQQPDFWEGVAMISSLIRARAYLLDTPEQFRQARAHAQELLQRSMDMRKQHERPRPSSPGGAAGR